ncbi:embryo-specific protein ATS3B-like [Syzygium oleosum]|uniref:embryo-specific protein ATS3B-like n=1 Tax=Syzygium oleosum TaxID=219896 RepID=UPI0011D25750|nr:embryo-specific protein ATS3B-like [Syzygium oleosum]
MAIAVPSLLLLAFSFVLPEARSSALPRQPHALPSFNLSYIQKVGSCSYTVVIATSCSSPSYTRDQISIAFGDAYGNQIYAPRLDDPSTRTFEGCSSDTFEINGPCAYQICYVYFYRSGPDGWKPDSVEIYGDNSKAVKFYYRTFIPSDIWYGFNLCNSAASSGGQPNYRFFMHVAFGFLISAFLYFCS